MIARAGFVRRFLLDQHGATAAEFALVLPVFLTLIFATINGSLMMAAANQLHFAAERTARCMSVDVGTLCDDAAAYAASVYKGPGLDSMTFTASTVACGNRVVGSGTYQVIGGLDLTSVTLSATACYPLLGT